VSEKSRQPEPQAKALTPANADSTLVGAPDRERVCVGLRNVKKRFGSLVVLDGLTMDFERGKTTVIIGPSGTGKSVLLKHIVGLLQPDSGEVWFNGVRMDQLQEQEMVESRKKVGFLFQLSALFDSMNVRDNICFPLAQHTKMTRAQQDERCREVLRMVGLAGIEEKMPAQLSGGQKKRVALARAVVLAPELILYDEPTTGLDPVRADVINELILELSKNLGVTSIVVTHDMHSANKIADRMIMLSGGNIIADGKLSDFEKSENETVKRFVRGLADDEDLKQIKAGFSQSNESDEHTPTPQA
jgi:phospholipid/cholesterol/gamma-HCH transport system ATP-binding protein